MPRPRKRGLRRGKTGHITNGARQEDVRRLVQSQRRRLYGVSKADADDPALESLIGRLHRAKKLSRYQYHLAVALGQIVRSFVSVAGGPRLFPKLSSVYAAVSGRVLKEEDFWAL